MTVKTVALWYSEGPGTSRYVVHTGSRIECEEFAEKFNNSNARWEFVEVKA